ncbi:MAG TPA: hypothetical protein DEB39_06750 [Planctomycetaceae bacterium]|nr:hypothetical protein [Planctomycetaceae bacterium]
MSVTIFQNGNGIATGFFNVSPGGILSVISIGDFSQKNAGASSCRAIVTDHPIEEAANANVMYAADGHIYMHVPGDKVGSMTVSGLAFSGFCQGEFQGESNTYNFNDQTTGFERVLKWYRANRVSNPSKNDPIEITLGGGLILKGYLGSFSARVADVSTRLYSFTLPMYIAPEQSRETN